MKFIENKGPPPSLVRLYFFMCVTQKLLFTGNLIGKDRNNEFLK